MTALIDTARIAQILGVTRAHATNVLTKHPTFPKPTIDLSQRLRRWKESDVMAWATSSRK